MENLKKNFGKSIKKYRLKRQLSQEELAEKIDIAVNNMGKIERGESFVTASTLVKLAEVLDVKVHEFFRYDNIVSIEDMKKEMSFDSMNDEDIRKLYKFFKVFID